MKKSVILILFLFCAGVSIYFINRPAGAPEAAPVPAASSTPETSAVADAAAEVSAAQKPRIEINKLSIPVELARTPAETEKGLSGRLSLDQDKGMLFMFARADIYSFWMPDMHFPLDMIWISSDKKVIGISADVSNDFDPANPRFYRPPSPAQYVLEVNAGFAARTGIKTGQSVTFLDIQQRDLYTYQHQLKSISEITI